MKTSKLVMATLGLCTISVLATQTALAAKEMDVSTEGTITFTPETAPSNKPSIPNEEAATPEDIIIPPTDGKVTEVGILKLQFVPNFNFGTHEGITAKRAEQNIELMSYKKEPTGTSTPIAPFVQVGDYRGAGDWHVTLSAGEFKAADASEPLKNVKILLPESTLTMEYHDSAEAGARVAGQDLTTEIAAADGGSAATIMTTIKDAETTSGYAVSNVFQKDYKKGEALTGTQGKTGVKFVKAAGQAPKSGVKYTSVLTWTLNNTL